MNAVNEFEEVVDHIYGVYLDATKLASIDYLDSVDMIYGKGVPDNPDSILLHRCSQKEYKERNTDKGINYKFIGNMALVSLYQYWEDHYRAKVADQFGLRKNELLAPIMGDIRLIRISIVHHAGVALREIEACEVLSWYKEGDAIFIDKDKVQEIILHVKKLIKKWKEHEG